MTSPSFSLSLHIYQSFLIYFLLILPLSVERTTFGLGGRFYPVRPRVNTTGRADSGLLARVPHSISGAFIISYTLWLLKLGQAGVMCFGCRPNSQN